MDALITAAAPAALDGHWLAAGRPRNRGRVLHPGLFLAFNS
jgi:hypothetical protein